ncbi:hypothetical protein CORC01_06324 [Colletotrichum orchidophilum]|uniref:Uncharacterized protein n=1 Tax=Colletotrichum orchidophilum TaxID=1209926 RepID=A0A1G4BAC0_9PEZI|nr:uncharacterized protein CORC01_06324 [Colletotrichum orchidophilum]OHE98328.1 hypothetical protein CORC01_06324 [Colletotrichum orchidophilum]
MGHALDRPGPATVKMRGCSSLSPSRLTCRCRLTLREAQRAGPPSPGDVGCWLKRGDEDDWGAG